MFWPVTLLIKESASPNVSKNWVCICLHCSNFTPFSWINHSNYKTRNSRHRSEDRHGQLPSYTADLEANRWRAWSEIMSIHTGFWLRYLKWTQKLQRSRRADFLDFSSPDSTLPPRRSGVTQRWACPCPQASVWKELPYIYKSSLTCAVQFVTLKCQQQDHGHYD